MNRRQFFERIIGTAATAALAPYLPTLIQRFDRRYAVLRYDGVMAATQVEIWAKAIRENMERDNAFYHILKHEGHAMESDPCTVPLKYNGPSQESRCLRA